MPSRSWKGATDVSWPKNVSAPRRFRLAGVSLHVELFLLAGSTASSAASAPVAILHLALWNPNRLNALLVRVMLGS